MRNDIGIIKLSKPVVLNKYIQVACLPPYKYGSRGSPYPSINIKGWVVGNECNHKFKRHFSLLNFFYFKCIRMGNN